MEDFTYEFIPWRGINKDTLRRYNVKTKIDTEGEPVAIGFPYADGSLKVRSLREKSFTWSPLGDKSKTGLFGQDKFDVGSHRYITITEGEIDALSLHQVLGSPCVSVQSAATAHRDVVAGRDFLSGYERIYLAFDNDPAGRAATRAVAQLFDYNKVYVVKFTTRKDANEYLQAGEEDQLRNIWWNAKKYLPETIVSSFSDFKEILKGEVPKGFPYPFETLTKMTYGIRPGETVLLLAQEKVGKTSIMREILYKLLKETDDAIAAIFLEEPKVRLLQSLAGRELGRPAHLPDSGLTPDELFSAVQNVVVQDDRLHLYSHFGSDDPDVILDTIRFLVTARGCRYVLFDHITMAVSGLKGDDERRALDYLATRLEMLSKELNFALIMVSHVNDFGQSRGSHYLTKVADIVVRAERDTMSIDPVERNTIHLSVPFNRFCAMSGPAGDLQLDLNTYILREVPSDTRASNDNYFPTAERTAA